MGIRDEFYDIESIYESKGYSHDDSYHLSCQYWIDKQEYKKLYDYFVEEVEGNYSEDINIYINIFLEKGEKKLYRRYWNFLFNSEINKFWYRFCHQSKKKEIQIEEILSYKMQILEENKNKYPAYQDLYLSFIYNWHKTIEFINKYIEAMQKINATEEIERAKILKESVCNLKKPKAKKTTDKRKMTKTLFWELIEQSREETASDSEFLDVLKDKLEAMSAVEIKKFQKILLEQSNELEHWDVWALAYIVRGGCGDDGFDYFKAWVISKGKEAFESVKNMQIEKFQNLFEEDPQFEEFMYVAQEAYANKKHEEMPTPRVKSQPIQGKEWSEESIRNSYPKLCMMFEY